MSTLADTAGLRAEITKSEASLARARENLQRIEASCPHNRDASAWGPTQESSETYKKEEVDVFAPMLGGGVDRWHQTRYVDARRTIWTRTCRHCGKTEKTTQTKPMVTQEPAF
jgi:hypothetical protein